MTTNKLEETGTVLVQNDGGGNMLMTKSSYVHITECKSFTLPVEEAQDKSIYAISYTNWSNYE